MHLKDFGKAGHTPSLVSAFLHFDISFMIWVLIGSLAVKISADYHLTTSEKAFMVAVPVLGGSFFRLILGYLTDRFGPKRVGTFSMFFVLVPLILGWLVVDSYSSILLVAPLLGVAGASFRGGPADGEPVVSTRISGPGDGYCRGRKQRHSAG